MDDPLLQAPEVQLPDSVPLPMPDLGRPPNYTLLILLQQLLARQQPPGVLLLAALLLPGGAAIHHSVSLGCVLCSGELVSFVISLTITCVITSLINN